ncbi:amino acid permease [Violaceomyces palustris]|uniref:Amino acid permease n=1 Tax=Violaceomyces palustris TaxID=1673888 RepID=A0ACD0NPG9_9BASI|nr:amino acid permease [Violaceomyces palustris]
MPASLYGDQPISDSVLVSPDVEKAHPPSPGSDVGNEKLPLGLDELGAGLPTDSSPSENTVKRNLKQRHISMIALGGTIGTGLFVGLGGALSSAGPVNTLVGYAIMGGIVWSMMIALGELGTFLPVSGGFAHYATRFLDPSIGFALGYTYWYSFGITLPVEISASAIIIQYWDTTASINPAVWISVLLVLVLGVNFLGVRYYGETEFWFCLIKIVAVIALIIISFVIDLGGGPKSDRIGFRYWVDPGPSAQLFWSPDPVTNQPTGGIPGSKGRFLSFWNVFVQAAFSFSGTEIIGIAVGEVENPRKNVPKAIKRVFWRILIFYILAIFAIGLVVPYNDPRLLGSGNDASASPFVIAISNAGIKVLPDIINAVLLITTWSAANSDLYASSRTLYGLALDHKAPKLLRRCTKGGLPIWSVAATSLFGFLAYMGTGSIGAEQAFEYLYDISAISCIIAWIVIMATYLRFYHGLKAHGIDRDTLPYKAPFQPYASYFGFFFLLLVLLFSGFTVFIEGHWDTSSFVTVYITIPIFLVLWLGWKFWHKTSFVHLEAMDFDTGRRQLDEMDEKERLAHPPPTSTIGKIWDWVM